MSRRANWTGRRRSRRGHLLLATHRLRVRLIGDGGGCHCCGGRLLLVESRRVGALNSRIVIGRRRCGFAASLFDTRWRAAAAAAADGRLIKLLLLLLLVVRLAVQLAVVGALAGELVGAL